MNSLRNIIIIIIIIMERLRLVETIPLVHPCTKPHRLPARESIDTSSYAGIQAKKLLRGSHMLFIYYLKTASLTFGLAL